MVNIVLRNYVIDTSSLIAAYPNKNARNTVERLIRNDRMKIPPGVLEELEIGGDEKFHWVNDLSHQFIQELTANGTQYLGYILHTYGNSFPDRANRGRTHSGIMKEGVPCNADPEVIALAMEHGWVVITEESSGIRGACVCENIKCMTLEEMLAIEKEEQLSLLD